MSQVTLLAKSRLGLDPRVLMPAVPSVGPTAAI